MHKRRARADSKGKVSISKGRAVWANLAVSLQERVVMEFENIHDRVKAGKNTRRELKIAMHTIAWHLSEDELFSIWEIFHRHRRDGDIPGLQIASNVSNVVFNTPPQFDMTTPHGREAHSKLIAVLKARSLSLQKQLDHTIKSIHTLQTPYTPTFGDHNQYVRIWLFINKNTVSYIV